MIHGKGLNFLSIPFKLIFETDKEKRSRKKERQSKKTTKQEPKNALGERNMNEFCVHYTLEHNGYQRVAVMKTGAKEIGDKISIDNKDWIVMGIGPVKFHENVYAGPEYNEIKKKSNNEILSLTEPVRVIKIVETSSIYDEKMYHDVFKYENDFLLDTWYENFAYHGVLTHLRDQNFKEQFTSPTAFEPTFGKDILDFGCLLRQVENKLESFEKIIKESE